MVNDTGTLSLADQGRITTGLEYYFGAFGTTVTLDEIINQARQLRNPTVYRNCKCSTLSGSVRAASHAPRLPKPWQQLGSAACRRRVVR